MAKARPGGEDYLFAILTGYREPPEGVTVMAGMHYNPYFSGGQVPPAHPCPASPLPLWPLPVE
jgi:ubiquinol-cytochrome c reductase cytochrome c1 subunit